MPEGLDFPCEKGTKTEKPPFLSQKSPLAFPVLFYYNHTGLLWCESADSLLSSSLSFQSMKSEAVAIFNAFPLGGRCRRRRRMRGFADLILVNQNCHCEEPRSGDAAIFIPDGVKKKIPTVKYSPLLRCPKSADTAFAVADFDRGAKPCSLVRPQDALASLARNDSSSLPPRGKVATEG